MQSSSIVGSDQIVEFLDVNRMFTMTQRQAPVHALLRVTSMRPREKERKEKVRRLQSCKRWRIVIVEAASSAWITRE